MPLDPVSSASGELYFNTIDLSLGGPHPSLAFGRYYASHLNKDGNVISALGNNWMHNFDLKLLFGADEAMVVYLRGKVIEFEKSGGIWQLKNPEPIRFQLIEDSQEYHLMDPSRDLIFTFGSNGKPKTIKNRNNRTLTLTYSGTNLSQVADGLGRTLSFTYSGDKLTQVQDQGGRSIYFSYTGDDLTIYTDARGNTTTYSYLAEEGTVLPIPTITQSGLMTGATFPEGNSPYTQSFDSEERVKSQSNSDTNTSTIFYDTPLMGITLITDPLGYSSEHTHEDRKNLTQVKDQVGETYTFTYDANNRRNGLTDRLGATTSSTYHNASGKVATHTDAQGKTTTFTYTAQAQAGFTYYNLTRIDYPDWTFTTMTYDGSGNVLSLTDQAGTTWYYTYNSAGQVLTATNPAGGVVTYDYNTDVTLASITDYFGNTTGFSYDAFKRVTIITHPDMTSRSFTYDNNDNILSVTDERGKVTAITYDANNYLETITDTLGKTVTLAYDGNDRLVSLADRLNKTTIWSYDALGRLGTATNPAYETFAFAYSPQGWLSSVTDPAGKTTTMTYNKEGVIASVTDPLYNTWSYTSDNLGRITRITSPLFNTYDYAYDNMGRLISYKNPLSQTTTYAYDDRGYLTSMILPDGTSAYYTRNNLELIARILDPNWRAWDRAYDQMGRLSSKTDPVFNTTYYDYDNRNRLSTITLPEGSLQLTYDASGSIIRGLYSDGTDLQYSYDDNGRLITANNLSLSYDARGDMISSNNITITRDNTGRVYSMILAPGKTVTYGYNSRGLVSQVTDWVWGATHLGYDDAGRLTSLTRPNGITTLYTYNRDGRLVVIKEENGGVISGVWLTRNEAGQTTTESRYVPLMPEPVEQTQKFYYDPANQIYGYAYDKTGRLTADDTRTYSWDLASRLTSYTEGSSTVSFTYDGLGMRTGRSKDGATISYVWNYALGIPSVSVVRQGASDIHYYIHLPGGILLHSIDANSSARRFYHYDEMGTTLFLTDDGATVTDSYGISPNGDVSTRTGSADNPFTFIGAYGVTQEGDTGLYYMRARYYDSKTGRFISRDPVTSLNPRRLNPYVYASTNPMRYIDPSGLDKEPADKWTDKQVLGLNLMSFQIKLQEANRLTPDNGLTAMKYNELRQTTKDQETYDFPGLNLYDYILPEIGSSVDKVGHNYKWGQVGKDYVPEHTAVNMLAYNNGRFFSGIWHKPPEKELSRRDNDIRFGIDKPSTGTVDKIRIIHLGINFRGLFDKSFVKGTDLLQNRDLFFRVGPPKVDACVDELEGIVIDIPGPPRTSEMQSNYRD